MYWTGRLKAPLSFAASLILITSAVAFASDNDDENLPPEVDRQETAAVAVVDDHDEENLPPDVVHQDATAAFAQDAHLMATQAGLPVSDVESALAFQDAFTMYGMEVLLPRYEDQISAIWVDPAPATRGYVRFVAEIPELARSEAARRGLDVVLTGGGEISMAEHARRTELVADVLVFNGFQNFTCGPDHKTGRIEIEIRLPEGSPELRVQELAVLIQEHISRFGTPLDGRAAEIRPSDLKLILVPGSGPLVVLD